MIEMEQTTDGELEFQREVVRRARDDIIIELSIELHEANICHEVDLIRRFYSRGEDRVVNAG